MKLTKKSIDRIGQQHVKDKCLNEKIWAERSHVCAECGVTLQDPPKKHYFAHILSRGHCKEKITELKQAYYRKNP